MGDEAAEKAWADYQQWRADEGNYGREGDEPSFMAGRASVHDTFDGLRSAVIQRVRELWAGWLIDSDAIDETLALAPSVVLDQMIREAKAEAWDEGFDVGVEDALDANVNRNHDCKLNPYPEAVAEGDTLARALEAEREENRVIRNKLRNQEAQITTLKGRIRNGDA